MRDGIEWFPLALGRASVASILRPPVRPPSKNPCGFQPKETARLKLKIT